MDTCAHGYGPRDPNLPHNGSGNERNPWLNSTAPLLDSNHGYKAVIGPIRSRERSYDNTCRGRSRGIGGGGCSLMLINAIHAPLATGNYKRRSGCSLHAGSRTAKTQLGPHTPRPRAN